jgi:hypothetical protein
VAAGRRQWRTSSCQALVNAHRWFGTGNAVLSAQMRGSADFARVSCMSADSSARTQLALRSRISGQPRRPHQRPRLGRHGAGKILPRGSRSQPSPFDYTVRRPRRKPRFPAAEWLHLSLR